MKQYRKIIAILMAATTSVVMSSEFESQAADPALDMAQVKILGEYKLTQPYGFNDAPEEALLNLKKATAQAEEQYQEMKRKEKEARERKAAESQHSRQRRNRQQQNRLRHSRQQQNRLRYSRQQNSRRQFSRPRHTVHQPATRHCLRLSSSVRQATSLMKARWRWEP